MTTTRNAAGLAVQVPRRVSVAAMPCIGAERRGRVSVPGRLNRARPLTRTSARRSSPDRRMHVMSMRSTLLLVAMLLAAPLAAPAVVPLQAVAEEPADANAVLKDDTTAASL